MIYFTKGGIKKSTKPWGGCRGECGMAVNSALYLLTLRYFQDRNVGVLTGSGLFGSTLRRDAVEICVH